MFVPVRVREIVFVFMILVSLTSVFCIGKFVILAIFSVAGRFF